MTDILSEVVTKKHAVDRTGSRISKAREQLRTEEIALQKSRWTFHEIVGPYPLKYRFKGPFAKAITGTDAAFYGFWFCLSVIIAWALSSVVGVLGLLVVGITGIWIASELRYKWARFAKWAKN